MEEIKVNEIRVNDYVRIKHNGIFKIAKIDFQEFEIIDSKKRVHVFEDLEEMGNYIKNDITKHSENITDLIEVGDILEIEDYGDISYLGWDKDTTTLSYKDMIEDIKKGKVKLLGIVTKEQFKNIKYEVN